MTNDLIAVADAADLLRRVALGERDAWQRLCEAYGPSVLGIARRIVGATDAEDVCHETFVSIFRHAASFRPRVDRHAHAQAWMRRLAINAALNWRRDRLVRARHQQAMTGSDAMHKPDTAADQGEDARMRAAVLDAVSSLPTADRDLVMLRFWEGRSHEEAAAALGASPLATRVRLHRALVKLRRLLKPLAAAAVLAVVTGQLQAITDEAVVEPPLRHDAAARLLAIADRPLIVASAARPRIGRWLVPALCLVLSVASGIAVVEGSPRASSGAAGGSEQRTDAAAANSPRASGPGAAEPSAALSVEQRGCASTKLRFADHVADFETGVAAHEVAIPGLFIRWRAVSDGQRPIVNGHSKQYHFLDGQQTHEVESFAAIVPIGVAREVADRWRIVPFADIFSDRAPQAYCCVDVSSAEAGGYEALLVPVDALRDGMRCFPGMSIEIAFRDEQRLPTRGPSDPVFTSKSGTMRIALEDLPTVHANQ